MLSKKEIREQQRAAEAVGNLFADEIKARRKEERAAQQEAEDAATEKIKVERAYRQVGFDFCAYPRSSCPMLYCRNF